MRILTIFSSLTIIPILLSAKPILANPQVKFFCGQSENIPVTFAQTPNGQVSVIRWASTYFNDSGYSPQRRCEEVSGRFQKYYDSGMLNFLTTGKMNDMNVVCTSTKEGGNCTGLLFTLRNFSDPSKTLQSLMNVRSRSGGVLNETTSRVYINMEEILQIAPTVNQARLNQQNIPKPVEKPRTLW